MGATYTRQSTYADGDTISAADTNDEFNQLLAAFAASTGHTHDGTAAEGGPISALASNNITFGTGADTDIAITFDGNTSDGVLTWMEDEDYFQFSDDILMSTTEKIQFRDTAIYINSSTDGQLDLVADTEIQIAATTIDVNGNLDVSGTVVGASTVSAGTAFVPDASDGAALGTSSLEFSDLFLADAAIINLGADQDTTLTHVADTGILLNSTRQLQFGDSGTYIHQSADGVLDLVSDTEIEINATTIDMNGNVDIDGTLTIGSAEISEAELEILDGATVTTGELNALDLGSTAVGTAIASKAVILDSNKDYTGIRNFTITGDADIDGTLEADAMTLDGTAITTVATLSTGISNGNLPVFTSGAADNDFLRIDGTSIEGRSAAEVLSDIGAQASLTFGISNTNAVKIDSASVADDEYARFTASGLESRATSEVLSDIAAAPAAGSSNIVTTGALNSGSITSGFGAINNGSSAITTTGTMTFGSLSDGSITVTAFVDEDDMSSDSATLVPTQQSVKAFVENNAGAPAAGSSNIVTTGALNSGSITSGFGAINNGSSAITTTGVITGGTVEATADTSAGDNAAIGYTAGEGLILTGQGSTSDITLKNDADATVFTVPTGTDDILFPDNAKVMLGAGSDLQIYHNGTNTFIDNNTGVLYIRNNVDNDDGSDIYIQAKSGENGIIVQDDGEVRLYHNNVEKLNTSNTGITVAGTVAATAVTGDGSGLTGLPAASLTSSSTVPAEGGTATTNVVQGLAKVWVQYNTSHTKLDSLNVSSVSDGGEGRGTININNDMNNTSYSVTYSSGIAGPAINGLRISAVAAGSYSTQQVNSDGAYADSDFCCTSAHGDLA